LNYFCYIFAADISQVNVFELGHTYLQLIQTLNLRLPLVDPSHYISRFAALLEFGDETHKVATDAVRLVQRFDRDWMTRGRRPAGICGAALLLAARMNNFRRSVEEIVQVVKIADTTLKKRLEEFKATPSGSLTLADFRNVWLDDEMDPPAFTKGREREEAEKDERERAAMEEMEGVEVAVGDGEGKMQEKDKGKRKGKGKERGKKGTKRKGKRKRGEESEEAEEVMHEEDAVVKNGFHPCPAIDPTLLNQGILEGTMEPLPLFMPDPGGDETNFNIDPALLHHTQASLVIQVPATLSQTHPSTPAVEETVSTVLAEEVSTFLQNTQGTLLSEALDEAEQRRLAQISVDDELLGLDEDELDRFLLSEEEVKIKERVWVELNKDYLEAIAGEAPFCDIMFIIRNLKDG
jgi:transcription factor IIIB subunit 2